MSTQNISDLQQRLAELNRTVSRIDNDHAIGLKRLKHLVMLKVFDHGASILDAAVHLKVMRTRAVAAAITTMIVAGHVTKYSGYGNIFSSVRIGQ